MRDNISLSLVNDILSLVNDALTNMVQAHQDSREEGTTKPIPPQETEKIWHGSSDPQKVLQLHHREHPDGLCHCLVWQLLAANNI